MSRLHAVMAEFRNQDELLQAARTAKEAGYELEAYSPFPVDGLIELLGERVWPLQRYLMLIGGIAGAFTGYAFQYYVANISYPLNVGGRPFHSWPAFIPVTFELTVLMAALTGFAAFLIMNGFPMLHHPVFNAERFTCCEDRFYLALRWREQFDRQQAVEFLRGLGAREVYDVDE